MNSSLRDQLLAAGLVTEEQARKAAEQQQRAERAVRHAGARPRDRQPTRSRGGPAVQQPPRQAPAAQRSAAQKPTFGDRSATQTPQVDPSNVTHASKPTVERSGVAYAPKPTAEQPPNMAQPPKAPAAALAARAARDVRLNHRKHEKALRKARRAELEQMVERTRVPRLESEDWYYFIDGRKIRRCAVDAQRRRQLMSGELVVVRHKGYYAVVPAETAERLREFDPQLLLPANPSLSTSELDSAYQEYAVPDDLMW